MVELSVRGCVHQELEDVKSVSVPKFKQVSILQQRDPCEVPGGQKFNCYDRTNGSFVVDINWPYEMN